MTIEELCLQTKCCGSCVFFPICVWQETNPRKWDKLTINVISDTIIKTAKALQEVQND